MVLTTHPLLAPRMSMSRTTPLLPSRPLVACYTVTFIGVIFKSFYLQISDYMSVIMYLWFIKRHHKQQNYRELNGMIISENSKGCGGELVIA
jgi:hypothetical protein